MNKESSLPVSLKKSLEALDEDEKKDMLWLLEHPEFEHKPVTIREFIDSPYYLNQKKQCRIRLKSELENIFGPVISPRKLSHYQFALLTGAIGIGKSYIAGIIFAYLSYRLLCLKDPQSYYGLAPGTRIAAMNMSTKRSQARDVLFSEAKARIDNSPWFRENYPYDPNYTNLIKFPKNIYIIPGDSSETTFEGYNIIGGAIDEFDSHKRTPTKDFAEVGFDTISGRSTSRFGDKSVIIILGQKKSNSGAIARRWKEFGKSHYKGKAYRVHLTIWEARNNSDFKGEYFYFNPGNYKFLSKKKYRKNKGHLRIPVEYETEFRNNPEKALRDLAGMPPEVSSPFYSQPDLISERADRSIPVPVSEAGGIKESFIAQDYKPRALHIDLGLNKEGGDACGIAMGHVSKFVIYERTMKPFFKIDLMMQLKAPPGGEIMIADVRKIVYYLRDHSRFNIKKITMDGFQSAESLQHFRKQRMRAELLSVDRDRMAHEALKEAIYENRILYYYYPIFIDEAKQLHYTLSEKVDHPLSGSKDVVDAVAGVVYSLLQTRSIQQKTINYTPYFGEKRISPRVEDFYGNEKEEVFSRY